MDETHLTPRQRQVVTEMCKGKSNKEIARALGMAESTVKLHLTEIFKTIGVKTRAQAILKASNFAVTTPEPLTDQEILERFTDTTFETLNESWSDRVIKFGRSILEREKK
jgi:DNA-binding CsgD family transcriptional regulator